MWSTNPNYGDYTCPSTWYSIRYVPDCSTRQWYKGLALAELVRDSLRQREPDWDKVAVAAGNIADAMIQEDEKARAKPSGS